MFVQFNLSSSSRESVEKKHIFLLSIYVHEKKLHLKKFNTDDFY